MMPYIWVLNIKQYNFKPIFPIWDLSITSLGSRARGGGMVVKFKFFPNVNAFKVLKQFLKVNIKLKFFSKGMGSQNS